MKGHGAMGQTTILPSSNKQQQQQQHQHQQHQQQQQQKNEESKVFIDIRNSAPDVIIMTSH